jgi:hypothetical protein
VDKHISLIVYTPTGKYAVAGDIFWWEDGQKQEIDATSLIEHLDPVAKNQALLQTSRKTLLGLAKYIIPGHGKIFTVPG